MTRKVEAEEEENHERWLVSYADFITLLFAFFVVMYAVSSVNEGKYHVLSNSLGTAFGKADATQIPMIKGEKITPIPVRSRITPAEKQRQEALRREKTNLTAVAKDISKALGPLVDQGKVRVTQSSRGISVEINASVLFAPGEAKLNDESDQALTAVAKILKDDKHAIQIEGHTDNVPISNAKFASNWELSSVRASRVVRLFIENGIAESRLTAVGHGSNHPVAENETAEGRLRNRRVEVMILSELLDAIKELPVDTQ